MKFSGKMCFKIILQVTKKQGFTISLGDTFFEKPQGGDQFVPPPPRQIRVKGLSVAKSCIRPQSAHFTFFMNFMGVDLYQLLATESYQRALSTCFLQKQALTGSLQRSCFKQLLCKSPLRPASVLKKDSTLHVLLESMQKFSEVIFSKHQWTDPSENSNNLFLEHQ